ncbi:HPr(Ser) kinase/phosphatase [Rubellicoccus peritrichatus]|uniref:HPr kinase/phosphorylase n=1 Tax=Rubellicoccus peritrichatus TaxID=3080537 RepID=A0AAQ3QVC4_9BACT|nr:HPr(Ser) kinase/phosphatase [Puniceicoccus sp. CR14]WOO41448.1 HPr(Ser) kinase/phosphatase [Puniceicoccus sp. CR14]
MPSEKARVVESVPVRDFFELYGAPLQLELVAGEKGLNKVIREKSINRPALALTGYYKYFANKRIQLCGAGEMGYLRDLKENQQRKVLEGIVKSHIPCLIISRNLAPPKVMKDVAEEFRVPMFRTPQKSKDFIAEATVLLEHQFAPQTTLHGTLLDVKGIGVLLRGKSGVGKSECALALIERGHSLVADDITYCKRVADIEIEGTSADLNRGYMECRGIGIINIAEMFGIRSVRLEKRIDLVVTFLEWEPGMIEERTGLEENFYRILDIDIPHVEIPVRPGRDMARLTEVAALVQALKTIGHDSANEFNERLIASMAQ